MPATASSRGQLTNLNLELKRPIQHTFVFGIPLRPPPQHAILRVALFTHEYTYIQWIHLEAPWLQGLSSTNTRTREKDAHKVHRRSLEINTSRQAGRPTHQPSDQSEHRRHTSLYYYYLSMLCPFFTTYTNTSRPASQPDTPDPAAVHHQPIP